MNEFEVKFYMMVGVELWQSELQAALPFELYLGRSHKWDLDFFHPPANVVWWVGRSPLNNGNIALFFSEGITKHDTPRDVFEWKRYCESASTSQSLC